MNPQQEEVVRGTIEAAKKASFNMYVEGADTADVILAAPFIEELKKLLE